MLLPRSTSRKNKVSCFSLLQSCQPWPWLLTLSLLRLRFFLRLIDFGDKELCDQPEPAADSPQDKGNNPRFLPLPLLPSFSFNLFFSHKWYYTDRKITKPTKLNYHHLKVFLIKFKQIKNWHKPPPFPSPSPEMDICREIYHRRKTCKSTEW